MVTVRCSTEFILGYIAFAALEDTLNGSKSIIAAVADTRYVSEQVPLKGGGCVKPCRGQLLSIWTVVFRVVCIHD